MPDDLILHYDELYNYLTIYHNVIIIKIKHTVNVMHLNRPQTIPPPQICGKTVFHETETLLLKRLWTSKLILCGHCLEMLDNFVFEFVFYMWQLMGKGNTKPLKAWGLSSLTGHPTSPVSWMHILCHLPLSLLDCLPLTVPTQWSLLPCPRHRGGQDWEYPMW